MKFKFFTAVAIISVGATTTTSPFSDAAALADVNAMTRAMTDNKDKQQKCKKLSKKCRKAIKKKDADKYKYCNKLGEKECGEFEKMPVIALDQCVEFVFKLFEDSD
mmetsp:Transcript_11117/g.12554  ORF Transcript_11117/g.12554 Transcript_11117/m.12554 type:complete len:106 (-) Transcript_11117:99-416(-)|eukprot:CAMPEP_0170787266 /NCGR_PEP_ID=MMETSP0733-20121128/18189_1 /TAXON_ID=186038 /ORGANISM="Fragilariopsis kerguelensis, Strain L26-C5" /LENGTH=105 /DNA_ID=CAMNT_0011133457 /DNA_START=29 /DNA_END=346 /DNA_ORIENTATION=+